MKNTLNRYHVSLEFMYDYARERLSLDIFAIDQREASRKAMRTLPWQVRLGGVKTLITLIEKQEALFL